MIKRKFDSSDRRYLGWVPLALRGGPVPAILSPTHFGKSSTSLRGDKLLPHPCHQALTAQPPACFRVCCFSIISFVSTVQQKPSVMFPCPLNLTILLQCPHDDVLSQCSRSAERTGHGWLAFIPRAAGLGIFVQDVLWDIRDVLLLTSSAGWGQK